MKVLVIGGGAAGLMAAGTAVRRGHEVTVLERNEQPARKVCVTGKGRCNVTNACTVQECIRQMPGDGRFLYSALTAFSPQDTMDFFEKQGVPLKVERGNRVFPVSDKATDIASALIRYAEKGGCRVEKGRAVQLLIEEGRCVGVQTQDGRIRKADAVIVCTGGASYPRTGSTGDGYMLAKQAGHTVTPLRPSLVPLEVEEKWCVALQGLSLRNVGLRVTDTVKNKEIYNDFGEMLFTHFGVSGPVILSASAHMRQMERGRYRLHIDMKPALSAEQLDARLVRELQARAANIVGNMLPELLPQRMVGVVAELCGLPCRERCSNITKEQRTVLANTLKNLTVTVNGFRSMDEAIVTAGGVSLKEIHAGTMASKLVKGLYFAGEVLDLDAYTGGFNLQIAFSTGAAAGRVEGVI